MSEKLTLFIFVLTMIFAFIGFVFVIYKLFEWIEEKESEIRIKKFEKEETTRLLKEIKAELREIRLIRK